MKRLPLFLALLIGGMMLMGADGCSSDPNVEGAKLDLRNKDYDRAMENLDKAIANDPNNAEAWMLKGQVYQEQAFATNDIEEHSRILNEMTAAYEKAREIDPEMSEDVQNRINLAYFNEFQRGVQAFQKGQEDESQYMNAAKYFGNAAMISPDSAGSYVNQAYAYMNAGQTEMAIGPFEMAIEKGDDQADTYIFLANLYSTNDQADKSIMTLEKARQMYPENEDVQAQLLNAYVQGNQVDRALNVYKETVERDPNNKLFRYNYGSLLLEAEMYDEAVEQLSKAVELDPSYSSAQYNLGAAYLNQAVAVNEMLSEKDDELREMRADLSNSEIQEREQEMEEMIEKRRALFAQAIGPLEKAREMSEAAGEETQGICIALFQAYAQTNQQDKAEALSECAGYDLN